MRQTYETELDRTAQQHVAATLERVWRCRAIPMPKYYAVDYALTGEIDNEIEALAEIKVRSCPQTDFRSYMLSLHKLMDMDRLAEVMKVRVFLVVQWSDVLGYLNIEGLLDRTERFYIGGRTDRGDYQDTEPVVMIPMIKFKTLS